MSSHPGAGLLGAGVVRAVAPPKSLPSWTMPILAAPAAVILGVIGPDEALAALERLAEPLAFLVLAVLLDRLGTFDVAAALTDRGGHLALGLWAPGRPWPCSTSGVDERRPC